MRRHWNLAKRDLLKLWRRWIWRVRINETIRAPEDIQKKLDEVHATSLEWGRKQRKDEAEKYKAQADVLRWVLRIDHNGPKGS